MSKFKLIKKVAKKWTKEKRKYGFSPRRIDESIKSVESQNVEFKSVWGDVAGNV